MTTATAHTAPYTVAGTSCGHCAAVTEELTNNVPGVQGVEIDLAVKSVTVTSSEPLDDELVKQAVEAAGYTCG